MANSGDLVPFQRSVGPPLDGSIMMVIMVMMMMMMMRMRMLLKKRMVMCSAVVTLEAVAGVAVLDADARGGAVLGPPRRLDASASASRRRQSTSASDPASASLSEPAARSSATPAATLSPSPSLAAARRWPPPATVRALRRCR